MKRAVAIVLSLIISIGLVTAVAYGTNRPAAAAPEAVCLPPVCVDVPTVTLPGVTVTRLVTLAPRTVRIPPVTVTRIIRPPQVTQTIIQPPVTLPGPVRTIVRTAPGLPGATTTATVVVSKEVVSNGTAPPVTREVRSTLPGGQDTVTSATVAPGVTAPPRKGVIRVPGTTRTVTKTKAAVLSLLALIILMAIGLLLLWLGFILGYKSSEKENITFLRALRDQVRRPGKHLRK